jgi:hypothetical protein
LNLSGSDAKIVKSGILKKQTLQSCGHKKHGVVADFRKNRLRSRSGIAHLINSGYAGRHTVMQMHRQTVGVWMVPVAGDRSFGLRCTRRVA